MALITIDLTLASASLSGGAVLAPAGSGLPGRITTVRHDARVSGLWGTADPSADDWGDRGWHGPMAMTDDGRRDAQRIVLCMSLLGACLGFLPHNFNPASIFLGDCGSLLLGFVTIVVVLTLGDTGRTDLVLAGLVIYSIPIMDTVLAIVRRKLAGRSLSAADDQHLHHMLKRALGVKGAVFSLYGIGVGFAVLGIAMSLWDASATYAVALVFASYIVVIAIKHARSYEASRVSASAASTLSPTARPQSTASTARAREKAPDHAVGVAPASPSD